ncbi:MAG: VWA domain-containing protein, partial [Alphaproteobacteria bacterium]|nr:VWA domain-containing protein [Alphaproteobacteria bacterium]
QDGEKSDSGDESQDGEDQDGEKKEGQSAEGKLGTDDKDSVPVEGAGDMPSVENPTENPEDEVDPDADGQDADGEGKDGEDLDDLEDANDDGDGDAMDMDELEEKSKDSQDGDGQDGDDADGDDADGQGKGKGRKKSNKRSKSSKPSKGAGKGDGKSLADLAKQDWTNYPERIKELGGYINRVRLIFKKVQEMQMQTQITKSKSLEILPQDGEVKDRFNVEAHKGLTIKKAMGSVEEDDLKRFHRDENKLVPAEVDIVIMIDGSGSMDMSGYALKGVTPLQSALQAAAILYEAAAGKDMHMNVYVGMWGNDKPPVLIKPGDDRVKVGQAMETMRKGLNSGTEFAPAVPKVAETISEHRGKSGALSGFTHVLVISDGDAVDELPSKEKIATMFKYSDKVTFDVAIITAQKGTAMEKMAKALGAKKPHQQVGVVLGKDPNEVPMAIVGLLLEKVRKCGSFKAVPSSKKRRDMKKALNKMDPKK